MTNHWSIINIEGYCGRGLLASKSPDDKPDYCLGSPEYLCLSNDCPHFFFCRYETGEGDTGVDCISKEKIGEFFDNERNLHMDDADGQYAYQKWLFSNYVDYLIHMIRSGIFDITKQRDV